MNDNFAQLDKTPAIKEIYNLTKKVLLLRDLSFITRLSKYYDLTLFNNSLSNRSSNFIDNKPRPFSNCLEKENIDKYKNFENQFNNADIKDAITIITGSKLEIDNTRSSEYKNIDNEAMGERQRQSQVDDLSNSKFIK